MSECVFCAIIAGSEPAARLQEDERTLAFLDINPATRGHALVIPKRHARDLFDVPRDDLVAVAAAAQRVARAAVVALGALGVNLLQSSGAAAFQTVFHLHVHVVPRYERDSIRLPWIPEPGDRAQIARHAAALRACL